MKRKLIGMFICLVLILTIIPLSSGYQSNPKIIYVDDDGGKDYTKIQDAIDSAEDEDTIFVYNGKYKENIIIEKEINLIGENKEETIINGMGVGNVVYIDSDNVTINRFKIMNCGGDYNDAGIEVNLYSDKLTISNNIITFCMNGIYMRHSNDNLIINNTFTRIDDVAIKIFFDCCGNIISGNLIGPFVVDGILLHKSNENILSNNIIEHVTDEGINIASSHFNMISGNIIASSWHTGLGVQGKNNIIDDNIIFSNFDFGIYLHDYKGESSYNIIKNNVIISNHIGIFIGDNKEITVESNNFNHNIHDVFLFNHANSFDGNYWGRPRMLPKIIFTYGDLNDKTPISFVIDWHPAKVKPNNIWEDL